MSDVIPHVFLTRFNLPANRVERSIFSLEWLTARMELFESFTVPSVRAQAQQGLSWVIYLDQEGTPGWLRDRMAELERELPLHPIYLDGPLDRMLIQDHVRTVSGRTRGLVATSNLDNDDGLVTDFVRRVRLAIPNIAPAALYLTQGLILHDHRIYLRHDRDNAFGAVFDEVSSPNFLSCWAVPHNQLSSLMPAVRVGGEPGWLQVVHGRNVSNRVGGRLTVPSRHAASFPGLIDDLPPLTALDRARDLVAQPARIGRDRVVRPGASVVRKIVGPRRYEALKMTFGSSGR